MSLGLTRFIIELSALNDSGLETVFIAKSPRRAGQEGKELRFLHGAIKWPVHARRQVGRKYQWCILREPVL